MKKYKNKRPDMDYIKKSKRFFRKLVTLIFVLNLVLMSTGVLAMAYNLVISNEDQYNSDEQSTDPDSPDINLPITEDEIIESGDYNASDNINLCYYCGNEANICECFGASVEPVLDDEEKNADETFDAAVEFTNVDTLTLIIGIDLNKDADTEELLLDDVEAYDEDDNNISDLIELKDDGGLNEHWNLYYSELSPFETPDIDSIPPFEGLALYSVIHPETEEEFKIKREFKVIFAAITCYFEGCPNPTECGRIANDGFTQIGCGQRLSLMRDFRTGNFRLVNNINLLGNISPNQNFAIPGGTTNGGWEPIAEYRGLGLSSNPNKTGAFRGILDGNNFIINGLEMRRGSNSGLFSGLDGGARVYNLIIILSERGIIGNGERKGGLSGNIYGGTIIDNVHVFGVPYPKRPDGTQPGGSPISGTANYIAGFSGVINNSAITNSSASNLSMDTGSSGGFSYAAGFVGAGYHGAKIDNCRVENVRINGAGSYAGGFVGVLYSTEGTKVTNSSVKGAFVRANLSYAGGFIGAQYNTAMTENITVTDVNVRSTGSYSGGFAGVIYDRAQSGNVRITNAVVETGNNYTGGYAAAVYNSAVVDDVVINKAYVRTTTDTGYRAGGFAGVIYNDAKVTNCYVLSSDVYAQNYGVGGFSGLIYDYANVSQCGVTQSYVTSRTHSAGGFAGGVHGLGTRVSINFVENTNVRGTDRVGGFAGELAVYNYLDNNYVNAWTRPSPSAGNPTPGPRPGLSVWNGPAKVMGSGVRVGGFVGDHRVTHSAMGIANAYAAIEVQSVTSNSRGGFTGIHYSSASARYRGTNYFDNLSSDYFSGVPATSANRWRGDSNGSSALADGKSFPQARNTRPSMLEQSNFVGWSFDSSPWTIEENISYPYFLFGHAGGTGGEVVEEIIIIPELIVPNLDYGSHKVSNKNKLIKLSDRGRSIESELIIIKNMQDLTGWEISVMASDMPHLENGELQLAPWVRFGDNIDENYSIYNAPHTLYRYDSNNQEQLSNWRNDSEFVIPWSELEAAEKDIRVLNSPGRQAGNYKTLLTWSMEIVP